MFGRRQCQNPGQGEIYKKGEKKSQTASIIDPIHSEGTHDVSSTLFSIRGLTRPMISVKKLIPDRIFENVHQ